MQPWLYAFKWGWGVGIWVALPGSDHCNILIFETSEEAALSLLPFGGRCESFVVLGCSLFGSLGLGRRRPGAVWCSKGWNLVRFATGGRSPQPQCVFWESAAGSGVSGNAPGTQGRRGEPAGLCPGSSPSVPVGQGADSSPGTTARMGFLKRARQLALPSLAPCSPLLAVPCGRVNPPPSTPGLTGTAEGGSPPARGWGGGGHPGARLPPPAPVPAAVPARPKRGGRERR